MIREFRVNTVVVTGEAENSEVIVSASDTFTFMDENSAFFLN